MRTGQTYDWCTAGVTRTLLLDELKILARFIWQQEYMKYNSFDVIFHLNLWYSAAGLFQLNGVGAEWRTFAISVYCHNFSANWSCSTACFINVIKLSQPEQKLGMWCGFVMVYSLDTTGIIAFLQGRSTNEWKVKHECTWHQIYKPYDNAK